MSIPEASVKLAHLVAIPTVSDTDADRVDLADHRAFQVQLEHEFPRAHALLEREQPGDFALLYTWRGRDPSLQAVAFLAHWDVVAVGAAAERNWTHPPFSGFTDDQFIWGRGTLDDKISVVALLEAVERLAAQGFSPQRTLYLCFGGDEEVSGIRGAGTIARTLTGRGTRLAAIFDEGGVVLDGFLPAVRGPVALVGIAEKGHLNIRLSTIHGAEDESSPEKSARGRINRAIDRIERSPFPSRLTDPVRELLRAVAPGVPWPARLLYRMPRLFSPILLRALATGTATEHLVRTTLSITLPRDGDMRGEHRHPATADITVRTLPGDSIDSVIHRFTRLVADRSVRFEPVPGDVPGEPVFPHALSARQFALVTEAVHAVFPESLCTPYLLNASTDSKHYLGLTGNIVRFTPIRLSMSDLRRVHGIDERVSHENLARAVEFYITLMQTAAQSVS